MRSHSRIVLVLSLGCGNTDAPAPKPAPAAQQPAPQTIPPQPQHPPPFKPPPAPGPEGSGAAMQDPTGFPPFHDWDAPPGPAITAKGSWSEPVLLTSKPGGGYRPQVAVGKDGTIHALYYERTDDGDLIRHRRSSDGVSWSDPLHLGHHDNRNWGPDIVARDDGSVVVVYDHALPDFRSRGFITQFNGESWSTPAPISPDNGGEVGSGHVAHGEADTLAYVFIGKQLGPQHRFKAFYRWFRDGAWGEIGQFTDGVQDAWHTNVERRPDGSMLAGWDVGQGGAETQLYVVDGGDGRWGKPENISETSKPGERVHFAFGPDRVDHLTWFHKVAGRPVHIYTRSGRPGAWGPTAEPSRGYGGFHFDPDIAVNRRGVLALVWGWDSGSRAEMVYSINRGRGWSPPALLAEIGEGKPGLASIDVTQDDRFVVVWNQGVRGYNEVYAATLEVN